MWIFMARILPGARARVPVRRHAVGRGVAGPGAVPRPGWARRESNPQWGGF